MPLFRLLLPSTLAVLALGGCDPFGTDFDDLEQAELYSAARFERPRDGAPGDSLKVMTWNVKFGAGRIDFFFDCHGERGWMKKDEVYDNLLALALHIGAEDPDILILNEVEVKSRRSGYIDQVQYLLDNTDLNFGAYAAIWRVDFVPSDGIGKIDMGNAILSRWPLLEAQRIALPLIGDQDGLTQYFYLKRNLLRARVDLPGDDDVTVVATHTAAFSQDGTKRRHIDQFKAEVDSIVAQGKLVVAGGDLNALPPDTTQVQDFPDSVCNERFEADDYSEETDWLAALYDDYAPAIPLERYRSDNDPYFTHTTDKSGFWNRKLDYLFTNGRFLDGRVHQDTMTLSDHAPVSAMLSLPR